LRSVHGTRNADHITHFHPQISGHPESQPTPSQDLFEIIFQSRYSSNMRRPFLILALCFVMCAAASAATGRVIKVLPQLLDLNGQHALTPSLYDRDAYQKYLRLHPDKISGMRFAVEWKVSGTAAAPLKLRIEVRGTTHGDLPPTTVLEQEVKPGGWFSHWASFPLKGDEYKKIGEVTAWRVTLGDNNHLLSEQKSFLW